MSELLNISTYSATNAAIDELSAKATLFAKVGDYSGITLMHNQILVATYVRPEKTARGIIRVAQTLKEDEYQGKVGLVLAVGPLAFQDDASHSFGGQSVAVGDWICYRMSDGWQLGLPRGYETVHCRMLEDVHIKAKLSNPEDVF